MKKLFGGLNLTWPKIIIAAVIMGIYTAVMAMLPITKDTSFADISISFEVWVLFGILIIVNCHAPIESALKCFVFFLISQPIVYLIQVPFNRYGWGIFQYYPFWFYWTLFTLVMGFVGYYMRKDKWWSILILVPMQAILGYQFGIFLRETTSFFPNHLLSAIFCVASLIIYPLYVFHEKKIKLVSLAISIAILIAAAVWVLAGGRASYNTDLLGSHGSLGAVFDDTYEVYLEDEAYGNVSVTYVEAIEDYVVRAQLTKTGETRLIIVSPEGEKQIFDVEIGRDTYEIEWAEP